MDILVPTRPEHLEVTPTMVRGFRIDPALGARVLLGIKLDAFKAAALRIGWWVSNVVDEPGFGLVNIPKTAANYWRQ